MQEPSQQQYHFDISLSVLNHLGRNLYRNFITVLGEAISNSWDANAKNVWVEIDQDASTMVIKDDGDGFELGNKMEIGNGLKNMKARAKEINAKLEITSWLLKGTRIELRVPV